nr:MAG TPA: hypothetical protein [Caudoviricetes sp.]
MPIFRAVERLLRGCLGTDFRLFLDCFGRHDHA